jgi:hypothetical protein
MTLINLRANERGVALILALGLLVVIAAVALIVALTSIMERGLTASERQQKVTFDSMQRVMEKAISQFNPRVDITGTGYPGYADTVAMTGGNFSLVSWIGGMGHEDTIIRRNPIHPLDFPRGMHQVGEAIYIRYSPVRATARMYRTGFGGWVAQKEAWASVDVGPYGWTP